MSEAERSETGALIAGRYRLGEAIGHGGMATVFRAYDEKLGRTVAVKVFTTGDSDADDTARRVREMRLLAAANHAHLVTLFDAEWPTAETPRPGFLVMELVDGESLRRRIDRMGADPDLARRVVIELSGALAYLHEQGIVHRDLKPENILIDSATGDTKLVDFGIAQFVGAERITTDGTVLGTAAYLSPEQVRGQPVAPAADVYALGLVVLECLTGRRAFPGPAVEAAIARLTAEAPIPAGLSQEWAVLLETMTAREASARPEAAAVTGAAAALDVPVLAKVETGLGADTVPYAVGAGAGVGAGAAVTDPTMRLAVRGGESVVAASVASGGAASAASASRASAAPALAAAEPTAAQRADAGRPRRRGSILLVAVAAALLGAAVLVLTLDTGHRDADAGPTAVPSPVPTVTVTAEATPPAPTPAAQRSQLAPTPLRGAGADDDRGAAEDRNAGAGSPGSVGDGHGNGRHAGHGNGGGR